jgi:signal transduction histidine kinase
MPVNKDDSEQNWLRIRIATWLRSLTFRVVALSSIWAVIALVIIATVIVALFRQVSERGFESVLSAHLFNLIGSVGIGEDGELSGSPNLGDLRFSQPGSGWYWSVEPISKGLGEPVRSLSMTERVPSPPVSEVPFNGDFQRSYEVTDSSGQRLRVLESEFVLGDTNKIARFRVMGNLSELEYEVWQFARRLYMYLAIFGAGMIAINFAAILFGLRPLGLVRHALSNIRAGDTQLLEGSFPSEIEPLAQETNALIESNRRVLERSRMQVGNLAHSLKTPLAVIMNEGRTIGGEKGRLIESQALGMQRQIDNYLQRARVAAQRDSLAFRTPVNVPLKRMARAFEKLNPDKQVTLSLPKEEIVFAGEREDLEEIVGNLLENATKWAESRIVISLARVSASDTKEPMFDIVIEDDGPGIPEEKAREALKRGRRLDESKPGTGLGLSIVSDLAEDYGGRLTLERSALGGLKAVVRLGRGET